MTEEFHTAMANHDYAEVIELSELIENRLYFMILSDAKDPSSVQSLKDWKNKWHDEHTYYLNIDETLVYEGFYHDFGPVNLAMVYRFVDILREKFKVFKKIIHCALKVDQKKRSNAAFLICAYMIIEHNWTAHKAYTILSKNHTFHYLPFRDASCLVDSEYSVRVEECVNALYKAKWYGFFNFEDFDVEAYEKYETVEFGDINWIIPGTMLAFSTPHTREYIDKSGYHMHSPAYYYEYFKRNNVKHVVRLNSKRTYDAKCTFVDAANIQHTDLFFTDGTPPPDSILKNFLCLCEQYLDDNCNDELTSNNMSESSIINKNINNKSSAVKCNGAVAVHCKAGLGRTGCLVASYIVKHWCFSADEAIAWLRICRPGSVIGIQQQWLINQEEYLKLIGIQWRKKRKHNIDKYRRFKNGVYSVKAPASNAYEYVGPPPKLHISYTPKSLLGDSINSKTQKCTNDNLSSVSNKKLRTNSYKTPNTQVGAPNLRQKSASKNEDPPKLKSSLSTIKNSRRNANTPIGTNVNNIIKKNSNSVTAAVTKSFSKASAFSKKNLKTITMANTRSSRTLTSNETTKNSTTTVSKPSYALATVSSSARVSQRLRNQNCNVAE